MNFFQSAADLLRFVLKYKMVSVANFSILYVCLAAENRKTTLKPPILSVQGHLRSLTLTPLKGVSLVLVMISSMSASICKRFHAYTQTNSGKITTFKGYSF